MRKLFLSILLFFTTATTGLFGASGYVKTWYVVLDTVTGQSQFYVAGQMNFGESTSTFRLSISSNAVLDLVSGEYITIASHTYIIGYASATEFFGNGAGITGVTGAVDDACRISTGAIQTELDLVEVDTGTLKTDLTAVEISTGALRNETITSTAAIVVVLGNLQDDIDAVELDTGTLKTIQLLLQSATGTLRTTQFSLQEDTGTLRTDVWATFLTTYTAGTQVEISTNLYVVGYASAAYFFGDGSGLFNIVGAGVDADCRISTGNILRGDVDHSSVTTTGQYECKDGTVFNSTEAFTTGGVIDVNCRLSTGVIRVDLTALELSTGTLLGNTSAQQTYGRKASSNTWTAPQVIDVGGGTALIINDGGDVLLKNGGGGATINMRNDGVTPHGLWRISGMSLTDIGPSNFETDWGIIAATGAFSGEVKFNGTIDTDNDYVSIPTNTYTNGYSSANYFFGDGSNLTNVGGATDSDCRISTGAILNGTVAHSSFTLNGWGKVNSSWTVINTDTTNAFIAYYATCTTPGQAVMTKSTDGVVDMQYQPEIKVYRTATSAQIPNGVLTRVTWNTVDYSNGMSLATTGASSGTITVHHKGSYDVGVNLTPVGVAAQDAQQFTYYIYQNGASVYQFITTFAGQASEYQSTIIALKCEVGDTLSVRCSQTYTPNVAIYFGKIFSSMWVKKTK